MVAEILPINHNKAHHSTDIASRGTPPKEDALLGNGALALANEGRGESGQKPKVAREGGLLAL